MKVGDYVRIKDKTGWCRIGKIVKIGMFIEPDIKYCIDIQGEDYLYPPEDIIVKSSPNIIDLIEEGDYVNGHRVIDIAKDQIRALYYEDINQKYALIPMINKDIKSIVTKEQFESMEYKVGEQ